MTPDPLRRLLSVQPFESFAIHMADRREFQIRHPEGAVIGDRGRTIVVLNEDRKYETLDILLVTSLRPLADRASADTEE
jgi:hypothetical protein